MGVICRALLKHLLSPKPLHPKRVLRGLTITPFRTFTTTTAEDTRQPIKHSILLERIRHRHIKDSPPQGKNLDPKLVEAGRVANNFENEGSKKNIHKKKNVTLVKKFEELGLNQEVMGALGEMSISEPSEIQCIGIPAVLDGKSVVLGSHTGSGKTLAYMLPLVQLLRRDEEVHGILMKPRRPRAVVLCPTRELCEQVFRVAKSISHHARFRSTMVSGGGRLKPQEDSLNTPIDMIVGTPGRVQQHIEDGNIVYGEIKYLVLDEADTMFDRGFGPDLRKFLGPLKNRASKSDDTGFQTVLVTATMTKAVQKLIEEEFQGIMHLRTSSLHKKIANARHDFIKLSTSENKLEALLQVLEPSLAKGNRVMVFCNTLNSSRAVDHFLTENQVSTVNYHGEVPAEQRVKNLEKFKSDEGDCPTLVCTDLAARGLDLDVDHVIMFDFPKNSIDYLHRTGRTARMGAKGKVTSLIARKDSALASRIEEAMSKNESLEALSVDGVNRDKARARISEQKAKTTKLVKFSKSKKIENPVEVKKSYGKHGKAMNGKNTLGVKKPGKVFDKSKSAKPASRGSKTWKPRDGKSSKVGISTGKKKIHVVGFRGRNSFSNSKGTSTVT